MSIENTYKGLRTICKDCHNASHKERMGGKPVEYRLWVGARSRARAKGLPFDLEVDDIRVPLVCPVYGVPLEIAEGSTGDFSPTLDKIIPERGYVKGNVQVISWRANRLKSNGTLDDFKAIVRWLEKVPFENGAKI